MAMRREPRIYAEPERWAIHPVHTNYAVSTYGNVERVIGGQGARLGLLKLQRHPRGYLMVLLSQNNVRKTYLVHRLVAETFLDAPKEGQWYVNHRDGDKTNNYVGNLEWVTPAQNNDHAINVLNKGNIKLTKQQYNDIRRKYGTGVCRQVDLALEYNVSQNQISQIVQGKAGKNNAHVVAIAKPYTINQPVADPGPEEWRHVADFPEVDVSSNGRCRNVSDGHIRDLHPAKRSGQVSTTLRGVDGRMRCVTMHELVALAWLGPRPRGCQVNHRNGDRSDNRWTNLEYVTRLANNQHYHGYAYAVVASSAAG